MAPRVAEARCADFCAEPTLEEAEVSIEACR
jgi:hypothetical protein